MSKHDGMTKGKQQTAPVTEDVQLRMRKRSTALAMAMWQYDDDPFWHEVGRMGELWLQAQKNVCSVVPK